MSSTQLNETQSALQAAAAFLTTQPDSYSAEADAVWAALHRRRVATLRTTACRELLDGMDAIGLKKFRLIGDAVEQKRHKRYFFFPRQLVV